MTRRRLRHKLFSVTQGSKLRAGKTSACWASGRASSSDAHAVQRFEDQTGQSQPLQRLGAAQPGQCLRRGWVNEERENPFNQRPVSCLLRVLGTEYPPAARRVVPSDPVRI